MPKISFIVPVYNTGIYIKKCLDSIINQTFKEEIEIILINDGSTDNSDELIKEYIENSNSKDLMKYYTKENEGIAKTRNFGIDKANGEYIFFVDSDDYIDKETIKMLKPYIDNDIDIIKFKLQRIDKNNNILEKVDGPVFEETSGEEAFNMLYSEDVLLDSPCVYVIKRNMFTQNNFKFNRTYHEDFGLIPLIILKAKRFVSIPDYLYYYVQGDNSITRNNDYEKTIKKFEDALFHYDNAIEKINKMNLNRKSKENAKIFYTNAIILKVNEIKEQDKDKYIKEIRKRKMYKNIKPRNIKQIIKRLILKFSIKQYLRMR